MTWLFLMSVGCVLAAVFAPLVAALIPPGHDPRPSGRVQNFGDRKRVKPSN